MVRICAVRAAAVSTVNAVAATSIPASRASARPDRNRSCDQASLRTAGTCSLFQSAEFSWPIAVSPGRVTRARPVTTVVPYITAMQEPYIATM